VAALALLVLHVYGTALGVRASRGCQRDLVSIRARKLLTLDVHVRIGVDAFRNVIRFVRASDSNGHQYGTSYGLFRIRNINGNLLINSMSTIFFQRDTYPLRMRCLSLNRFVRRRCEHLQSQASQSKVAAMESRE